SEMSISPLFRWPNSVCHYNFNQGEWTALDELLAIQTDVTVIWLTRTDTGDTAARNGATGGCFSY
uniref:hypothetical protein n=1 Tax=Klebsiella aerogenes TaxID=548 RepID=UPI001C60FBB5